MLPIVHQCPRLIVIVTAGNRQNGKRKLGVSLRGRVVAVPVRILLGMHDPLLEDRRGVTEKGVEVFKWCPRFEPAPEALAPEGESPLFQNSFYPGRCALDTKVNHCIR